MSEPTTKAGRALRVLMQDVENGLQTPIESDTGWVGAILAIENEARALPATPAQPDAVAALAEAIPDRYEDWRGLWRRLDEPDGWGIVVNQHKLAKAILAALPSGWHLTNEPDAPFREKTRQALRDLEEGRAVPLPDYEVNEPDATVVALREAASRDHSEYAKSGICRCGEFRCPIFAVLNDPSAAQAAHDRIAAQARKDERERWREALAEVVREADAVLGVVDMRRMPHLGHLFNGLDKARALLADQPTSEGGGE